MKKILVAVITALVVSLTAFAQSTQPVPQFSITSGPATIQVGGQAVIATDVVGSFALTKAFTLETDNIMAPAINLQAYYGGVKYYAPFFQKALAKTSASAIVPYFHGAFGAVRNVPATGATTQHYSVLAGGGFDYNLGSSFSVGPRVEYASMPGFGKSPHAVFTTINLNVLFGQK